MAIKNDLVSQVANFVSMKEVVETLSELEKVSKRDVITWLLNADSVKQLPETYSIIRATGSVWKEDGGCDLLFSAQESPDDLSDEEGWLLSEIAPYLKALLNSSKRYKASNEEQKQPTKSFGLKSILTAQTENATQHVFDKASPNYSDKASPNYPDKASPNYPPELDIALQAWRAVSSAESKGKPKARIKAWLDSNTTLSSEAKERIATVANWDKTGGATRTD